MEQVIHYNLISSGGHPCAINVPTPARPAASLIMVFNFPFLITLLVMTKWYYINFVSLCLFADLGLILYTLISFPTPSHHKLER